MILATTPLHAERVWCAYYYLTEVYDREVCTGRQGDTAWPQSNRQAALVEKNALELRKRMIDRGFEFEEISKVVVSTWNFETWKTYSSNIRNLITVDHTRTTRFAPRFDQSGD